MSILSVGSADRPPPAGTEVVHSGIQESY